MINFLETSYSTIIHYTQRIEESYTNIKTLSINAYKILQYPQTTEAISFRSKKWEQKSLPLAHLKQEVLGYLNQIVEWETPQQFANQLKSFGMHLDSFSEEQIRWLFNRCTIAKHKPGQLTEILGKWDKTCENLETLHEASKGIADSLQAYHRKYLQICTELSSAFTVFMPSILIFKTVLAFKLAIASQSSEDALQILNDNRDFLGNSLKSSGVLLLIAGIVHLTLNTASTTFKHQAERICEDLENFSDTLDSQLPQELETQKEFLLDVLADISMETL